MLIMRRPCCCYAFSVSLSHLMTIKTFPNKMHQQMENVAQNNRIYQIILLFAHFLLPNCNLNLYSIPLSIADKDDQEQELIPE